MKANQELILNWIKKLLKDKNVETELPEELQSIPEFMEIYDNIIEIRKGIHSIEVGELDYNISGKGYTLGMIKTLQASLKHLTWQTKVISSGDFSQRVDFMGEFSDAFNSMTQELYISIEEVKHAKSDLEQTYKVLQESENKVKLIFENSPIGIFYYDNNGKISMLNARLAEIFETSKKKIQDKINVLKLPNKKIVECIARTLVGETAHYEDVYESTISGKSIVMKAEFAPIKSESGVVIGGIAIVEDFTERKQLEDKIVKLSITDKLTQIYNRLKLDEVLEMEYRRSHRSHIPFSAIILDIDHFKAVNDNYGHQIGDSVLKEIANILQTHVRETDVVGRWGGEEFLVIATNTDLEGGRVLAEKLRLEIESFEFTAIGKLTCSFGVAAYKSEMTISSLISTADKALYRAKENGRNRVEIE